MSILVSFSVGATFALPEAAGAASAANCFREREAAEAEGPRGEPGGKAQEDSGNERPGGLQQGHQWQPVYVFFRQNKFFMQHAAILCSKQRD